MDKLPPALERKLIRLGTRLIDPKRGRRLVEPTKDRDGFWFGGGNSVRDPRDGSLYLIGRYRDAGDSRTGLTAGSRGRALAIFRSTDNGRSFAEVRTWDKSDLYCGSAVLSIEGSALRLNKRRVQVLVSTEKVRLYPRSVAAFQKPGTGVWSIDAFAATSIDLLDPQESIAPLLSSDDPAYLHLKDPNLSVGMGRQPLLLYCAHPYTWSASTSGRAVLAADSCESHGHDFFPPRSDLGCGGLARHLPPTSAQAGRVRSFALALALFLRRSRVHAPAQSTYQGGHPATRLFLRGIGRLGLWLRSPISAPSPPQLPPAALRLAGRHGLLALRIRADRSGRRAVRHLAALDPNPLAAAFRPPAHAKAGRVPALLNFDVTQPLPWPGHLARPD